MKEGDHEKNKQIRKLEVAINKALSQLRFFDRNSGNIGSWSFKESLKKTIREVEQALK